MIDVSVMSADVSKNLKMPAVLSCHISEDDSVVVPSVFHPTSHMRRHDCLIRGLVHALHAKNNLV